MDDEIKKNYTDKKKSKKNVVYFVIIAVFIIIVSFFLKLFDLDKDEVTTITESSLQKVIEISDLSTLDYTYNAITEVYDDDGKTLKYYVAYEGTVTAGIDFTKIDVSVDDKGKKIIIKLPNAKIQNVNVNMGTLEFIFEKNKYETETVSQEAYKASLEDLTRKANEEKTLLSMAQDNATAAIYALITPWVEQIESDFTIEVK